MKVDKIYAISDVPEYHFIEKYYSEVKCTQQHPRKLHMLVEMPPPILKMELQEIPRKSLSFNSSSENYEESSHHQNGSGHGITHTKAYMTQPRTL